MRFVKALLCLSVSLLSSVALLAQPPEVLYLNESRQPVEHQTGMPCYHLHEGEVDWWFNFTCYSCYDNNDSLTYQLSGTFAIDALLVADKRYQPYVKTADSTGVYLLGQYKDGKPYNGFFRVFGGDESLWKLTDFYENGVKTEMFYCDLLAYHLNGRHFPLNEQEDAWKRINAKGTYKNGKPYSGINILSGPYKYGEARAVEYLLKGKTVSYLIDLKGMELISLNTTHNGYLITSLVNNSSAEVTYTDSERIVTFKSGKTKTIGRHTFPRRKLADIKASDIRTLLPDSLSRFTAFYSISGNDIVADITVIGNGKPLINDDKDDGSEDTLPTDALLRLAHASVILPDNPVKLSTKEVLALTSDSFFLDSETSLGSFFYILDIDSAYFGFRYEQGIKKGTYNAYYKDLASKEELLLAKGKTTEELRSLIFRHLKESYLFLSYQ